MSSPALPGARGICHVARDVTLTGGGEVVRQLAAHHVARGVPTVVVTDSAQPRLDAAVQVHRTALGGRMESWAPRGRTGRTARHLARIAVFTVHASVLAARYRRAGWVTVNHNAEAVVGDVLVAHNVFGVELADDVRRSARKLRRLANPVLAVRLAKEVWLLRVRPPRAVVAVSGAGLDQVRRAAAGAVTPVVLRNGIDTEHFRPVAPDARRALADELGVAGRRVLLFVGHEFDRKGLAELLAALALLPPDVVLLVVGGRSDSPAAWHELARQHGVAARITFLGSRSDVARILPVADAFVLPSRYETFGLVLLEAMASGVPVVMTPVGGAAEFLRDGVNGFLVTHEPADIARGVAAALSGDVAARRRAARATALELDWASTGDGYLRLARELSAPPRTA